MKHIILCLAVGLALAMGDIREGSAEATQIGLISCCVTNTGEWCCAFGFPPTGCVCSAGSSANAASILPLPQGTYLGHSPNSALQNMLKALPAE